MRSFAFSLLALQLLALTPPVFAATPRDTLRDAIDYAVQEGFLEEESDGLLHPEHALRRVDLVRGIVHAVYANDVHESCFKNIAFSRHTPYSRLSRDITITAPYAQEICVGMLTGIIQGKTDGYFRPDDGATLAEAAKVIAKSYGLATSPASIVQKNVPWHEPFWYALARRNVLPERVRNDRNTILTRGEFAEIIYGLRNVRPVVGARFQGAFTVKVTYVTLPIVENAIPEDSFATFALNSESLMQSHIIERKNKRLFLHQRTQDLTKGIIRQ